RLFAGFPARGDVTATSSSGGAPDAGTRSNPTRPPAFAPPSSMKILIFNWQDIRNPLAGGAEVHLHEIFSRIARMGHEVTLFCSSFRGAEAEETIDGIRVIRRGGRHLFNFHVPIRYW